MARVNMYFEDLNERAQEEVRREVRERIKESARECVEDNPNFDLQSIESEMVNNYINRHNYASEFVI